MATVPPQLVVARSDRMVLKLPASVKIITWLKRSSAKARLSRKKKALLIGINYEGNGRWALKGAQRDVRSMKQLLIDSFGFSEKDITILSDEFGIADTAVANYGNMMQHLERFVENDDGNTDYVFVYSGHSAQRDEDITAVEELEEEDGQEEFVVPCDALQDVEAFTIVQERLITDKTLKKCLVKPLKKGSQLVAFFDSCHSGTLLNLKHHRCNRTGDVVSLIQDTARRLFIEPLYLRASKSNAPRGFNPSAIKKSATVNSAVGKAYYIPWKGKVFCHGFCPRMPLGEKPQVVCVSACKDRQNVLEGGTILPAIMELLRKDPNPTYREVMRAARSGIEPKQTELKEHVNERMKRKKCHWPLNKFLNVHRTCFTAEERDLKEMARLGCDPQLSSRKPLNTKGRLSLSDRLSPQSMTIEDVSHIHRLY